MFQLCPDVPGIHLPWRLIENSYYPRRFTLFLFLICNYCITAPIVEEMYKAVMLRRVIHRFRIKMDPNKGSENTSAAVSIRAIVVYMLGITYGIKTADNARRILLYAHPSFKHKGFFAIARSIYPVQEICSILSALNFAKTINKDKRVPAAAVDVKKNRRRSVIPYRSILLHSMACLRGMKPLFVWDSSRPWDEIQLQAMNAVDARTPVQLAIAGVLNFMWFGVLYKYIQVVIKKYFTLSRDHFRHLQEEAFAKLSSMRRTESQYNSFHPPLPPD